MKYSLSFLFSMVLLLGCERDDFCIEPTTPKLIIRFLDFSNPTDFKTLNIESLNANGLGQYSEAIAESIDSIAIPLDFLNNQTTYFIQKENEFTEELEISYTRENIFVSRSCGFKVNFNNFTINQITNHWIQDIQILNSSLENEERAHLHIFH